VSPATTEALSAGGEELLVEQAKELRFEAFARVAEYFAQVVDPDGSECRAEEEHARRSFHLSQSLSGTWHGTLRLDSISGAVVAGALQQLEAELYEAERAAMQHSDVESTDDHVNVQLAVGQSTFDHQARTPAQRRADALVEMATRAMTAPADGRRPAPLVSVLVNYETLTGRICELANGTVVAPGSLLGLLDEAVIERAVFGPAPRVEIGNRTRLFSGATRRAIELRDRCCTHPYCDVSVERCQVDHIVEYSKGGLTTQENGRLLCGFHNRLRNTRPPPGEIA